MYFIRTEDLNQYLQKKILHSQIFGWPKQDRIWWIGNIASRYLQANAPVLEFKKNYGNRVGIGLSCRPARARIYKRLRSPGIASLRSLAGQYDK